MAESQERRAEIYTYEAPHNVFAMNWSVRPSLCGMHSRRVQGAHAARAAAAYVVLCTPCSHQLITVMTQNRSDSSFRLAVASYLESYKNCVEIITRACSGVFKLCLCNSCRDRPSRAVDDETGKFQTDPNLTFDHPYPANKVMFLPDRDSGRADLLATTGDFLRIWHVSESGVKLEKLLNTVRPAPGLMQARSQARGSSQSGLQNKNTDYCAPLTSFDWNEVDPKRLGTASIDTTCTIWDIEVRAAGSAAHGQACSCSSWPAPCTLEPGCACRGAWSTPSS